ncbi:MAG: alpha/beta hydrolase [Acidimicrobiia bacterium]|nr:alpha/beta hydrolase [Acidimicrobiia bacterium]
MKGYANTNGIKLHYLDYGGNGPTLLLAHGLTANAHSFEGLVAALDGSMRVIAVDLRGRGLSDKPASGYSLEDHARDLLGLLDELGLYEVVVAGHSYGGALAYVLAAEYPERITACIAIDAPAAPDPGILDQIQPVLDRLEVTFPSMEAYLEHVQSMPWFDGKWNDQLDVFYRTDVQQLPDGSVRSRARPAAIRQSITGLLDVDLAALVASIAVPTLLIRAIEPLLPGAPLLFPKEEAESALESLRDGRLIEIKGHHYDVVLGRAATETAAAIRGFVAVG